MGAIHAHAALLASAGGGAPPSVPDLFSGGRKGFHITPRDWGTVYVLSNAATPVTAVGQTIGYLTDLSGNNNTRFQSEGGSPISAVVDGVTCADFAGGKIFGGNVISRTTAMDLYVVLRLRTLDQSMLIYNGGGGGAGYVGLWQASGASSHGVSGSPTYAVNGVATTGGLASDMLAALSTDEWLIVEVRNADLATFIFWESVSFGYYSASYPFGGCVSEMILCESTDASTRTAVREYLAAANNITL